MTLSVALRLGRVSNLPTIWSNTLAATVLAGGEPWVFSTLVAAIGISLLYVAGMYLNDAFDRDIDARERPSRPIASGLVSANTVFAAGFGLMLGGLAFVLWAGTMAGGANAWRPMLAALLLAGAILFYDWNHKGNALSPLFMGLCRVLGYLTAGYAAIAAPSFGLFLIALVSLSYLIGLTYIAKQEAFDRVGAVWPLVFLAAPVAYSIAYASSGAWYMAVLVAALVAWIGVALFFLWRRRPGDVGKAVAGLIAGISLVDAIFLAGDGAVSAAFVAAACFIATCILQRFVAGT